MKCLVTGATGYIGRHLCRQLIARGDSITALSKTGTLLPDSTPTSAIDLARSMPQRELFEGVDVVFHLAGIAHQNAPASAYRELNELATLQYREGLAGYQRVLDSQQALFGQQQRYVDAQSDTVRNLITLHKALASTWQGENEPQRINNEIRDIMEQRTDWGDLLNEDAPPPDDDGQFRDVDW